jgi:hypothetical protein
MNNISPIRTNKNSNNSNIFPSLNPNSGFNRKPQNENLELFRKKLNENNGNNAKLELNNSKSKFPQLSSNR